MRFDWSDGDPDHEAGFYILNYTQCATVLTESFFYDSDADLQYLESEEGSDAIVRTHVERIGGILVIMRHLDPIQDRMLHLIRLDFNELTIYVTRTI